MSNAVVNSVSLVSHKKIGKHTPQKNRKTVAEFEVLAVFNGTNIFIAVRVQMKCEDLKSAHDMP